MKTFKLIGILFIHLLLLTPHVYSQIDLFDDEDDGENQAIQQTLFGIQGMKLITGTEEAGPVGNWMSDALATMNDAAFKDAPREYLAARSVIRKSIQLNLFSQQVAYGGTNNLPCEDRKKVLEKYSLFLGTLYLDMFNMDFFLDENREFSDVELANIYLAYIDVSHSLNYPLVEHHRSWLNSHCVNDLSDMDVMDCGEISNTTEAFKNEMNNVLNRMDLLLKTIHPENVTKEATNVANTLSALPCNK